MLAQQTPLRLSVFAGLLVVFGLAQSRWRLRGYATPLRRWSRHLTLAVLGSVLVRLLFPITAVAVGAMVDQLGYGILQLIPMPRALLILTGVVVLDLAIYLQHRVFHRVPWLWRLHRMHHSDTAFEVTTAIRFHPLEIALSMLIKIGIIVIFGIPALAVLCFEILLNATALFSHADLKLPLGLDRALQRVIVTPDMHRVHHSVIPAETNSNFGFCLSIWDRILGTRRTRPRDEQLTMPIGLAEFRAEPEQSLLRQLLQPLR